jgi:hypothetical protein
MPETLSLFESPPPETKVRLKSKLRRLATENRYLGTSSWKYEGWLDQIYTPERYRLHRNAGRIDIGDAFRATADRPENLFQVDGLQRSRFVF